jgi:predicted pyridoxine 5'-phosphate oxidase superfamily flavin-nucleotide-binding protein
MDQSPFHLDEITAQTRAGVHVSGAGVWPFMPDQHRAFFTLLRHVFVSVPDRDGWPLATVLTGPAGFIHAPSPSILDIDGLPHHSDPAASGFSPGNEIGILGLDFATRRRNRANGRIATVDRGGFSVDVTQSFGNCAQYIQTRIISADGREQSAHLGGGEQIIATEGLDDHARRLIGASDTLFVASRSRPEAGRAGGLDMSHRGGRPGFVRVEHNTLSIPDFKGNRFFNTLGNFLGDNRAGLLFIDFETGDLLQMTGTVSIEWDPAAVALPTGAQRLWSVAITRSWWRRGAMPFAWQFGDYAPTTLLTGVW